MKDKRYFFSVGLITAVILAVGAYVWSTGTVHLETDTETLPEAGWYRGEDGAPLIIDVYPDFT